jgi:hypothetical protein
MFTKRSILLMLFHDEQKNMRVVYVLRYCKRTSFYKILPYIKERVYGN